MQTDDHAQTQEQSGTEEATSTEHAKHQEQTNEQPQEQAQEQAQAQQVDPEAIKAALASKDAIIVELYKTELEKAPESIRKAFEARKDAIDKRLVALRKAVQEETARRAEVEKEVKARVQAKYPGITLDLDKGPEVKMAPPRPTEGNKEDAPAPAKDKNRPLTKEQYEHIKSSPFGLLTFKK